MFEVELLDRGKVLRVCQWHVMVFEADLLFCTVISETGERFLRDVNGVWWCLFAPR